MNAHAKINLALVVGPIRADGKHEIVTVLQRIEVADEITLEPANELAVAGFDSDTIVRAALVALATAAGVEPRWRARIEKRIPVSAGFGGGSSDAAAALRLANETLADPLPDERLRELAGALGADVPFFLAHGSQLGTGDGSTLERLELPLDYSVVLLLPRDVKKASTAAVYAAFDHEIGFEKRCAELRRALKAGDLAAFPPNDLASSQLAFQLLDLGAFRADVSGAGPAVYGLFRDTATAKSAAAALEPLGRTWITRPSW